MIIPDFRNFQGKGLEMVLCHSAKGTKWSNHKYVAIKNGRYIYPEDVSGNKGSNKPYEKSGGSSGNVYDEAIKNKNLNTARIKKNAKSKTENRVRNQKEMQTEWNKLISERNMDSGMYKYDPETKEFSRWKFGEPTTYVVTYKNPNGSSSGTSTTTTKKSSSPTPDPGSISSVERDENGRPKVSSSFSSGNKKKKK